MEHNALTQKVIYTNFPADCTAKEAGITAATTMDQLIAVVAPVNTLEP